MHGGWDPPYDDRPVESIGAKKTPAEAGVFHFIRSDYSVVRLTSSMMNEVVTVEPSIPSK